MWLLVAVLLSMLSVVTQDIGLKFGDAESSPKGSQYQLLGPQRHDVRIWLTAHASIYPEDPV